MANFEEKILAYLDDSLPAEEGEAMLQETHRSPEARALFEAHVRLGSLYALTAKPVSAPLEIQRELALKVPVLAMKLPYLAMPEKRRKRAAAWFWDSRMNMVLLLLAALLAGGIWYALRSGGSGNVSRMAASSKSTMGGSTTGGPAGGNSPHNISTPPQNVIPPKNIGPPQHEERFGNQRAPVQHRTSGNSDRAYGAGRSDRADGSATNSRNAPNIATVRELLRNPAGPGAAPAVPTASSMSLDTFALPPLRAISVSPEPARLHSSAIAIPISGFEENNAYTPVRAFAEENIRSTPLAPQAQPSDFARKYGVWQSSVTSQGEEFGVDYEISPWLGIGARGGNARFIQAQQISHLRTAIGSYGHVSQTISETALLDPFAPWACASVSYLVNPAARMEYEMSAGGGDIFLAGGFSPTLLGEAAATYRITNSLSLRASFSYQASWTAAASAVITGNNSQPTVNGSAIQSLPPKLYPSQAFGFAIGVAIHP